MQDDGELDFNRRTNRQMSYTATRTRKLLQNNQFPPRRRNTRENQKIYFHELV